MYLICELINFIDFSQLTFKTSKQQTIIFPKLERRTELVAKGDHSLHIYRGRPDSDLSEHNSSGRNKKHVYALYEKKNKGSFLKFPPVNFSVFLFFLPFFFSPSEEENVRFVPVTWVDQ